MASAGKRCAAAMRRASAPSGAVTLDHFGERLVPLIDAFGNWWDSVAVGGDVEEAIVTAANF